MGRFSIDLDRYRWIDGSKDDPDDYCLHGHLLVQIGEKSFEMTAP